MEAKVCFTFISIIIENLGIKETARAEVHVQYIRTSGSMPSTPGFTISTGNWSDSFKLLYVPKKGKEKKRNSNVVHHLDNCYFGVST